MKLILSLDTSDATLHGDGITPPLAEILVGAVQQAIREHKIVDVSEITLTLVD